ncbi:hypothetical protein ACFL5O_11270 [Myxococcota bacterium]
MDSTRSFSRLSSFFAPAVLAFAQLLQGISEAAIRVAPDGAWIRQMARNWLDPVDGSLGNASYLTHDRRPREWAATNVRTVRTQYR